MEGVMKCEWVTEAVVDVRMVEKVEEVEVEEV